MQRAGMKSWMVVLYAFAIVAMSVPTRAQGTAASIQGVIVDESGPLPGATIVAKDTQSGFVFETVAGSDGSSTRRTSAATTARFRWRRQPIPTLAYHHARSITQAAGCSSAYATRSEQWQ
jgi:hypothetical protein